MLWDLKTHETGKSSRLLVGSNVSVVKLLGFCYQRISYYLLTGVKMKWYKAMHLDDRRSIVFNDVLWYQRCTLPNDVVAAMLCSSLQTIIRLWWEISFPLNMTCNIYKSTPSFRFAELCICLAFNRWLKYINYCEVGTVFPKSFTPKSSKTFRI
jgi:hypothetical protein